MKRILCSLLLPLLFLFLLPFALGFFDTPVEDLPPATVFDGQKPMIEEELEKAREEYAALSPEDETAQPRQKILFYQTALEFSLPIWNGDFYFESASVYASILREWEILNAHTPAESEERRLYLETKLSQLEEILRQKNSSQYLLFYKNFLEEEGVQTKDEIEETVLLLELNFLATQDAFFSPGEKETVRRIQNLEKSLREGVDFFHPSREKTPLPQEDREEFKHLSAFYRENLREGNVDPFPGNGETLSFFTFLSAFSLFVVLLLVSLPNLFPLSGKTRVWIGMIAIALAFSGLALATVLFVPDSLVSEPVFIFGTLFSVPPLFSLFLHLLFRLLSHLPFFFLGLIWNQRTGKKLLPTLLIPFSALCYGVLGILLRLFLAKSPLLPFLPFFYTDLDSAFFPAYPFQLPRAPIPILVPLVFAALCSLFFFLLKKSKKEPCQK